MLRMSSPIPIMSNSLQGEQFYYSRFRNILKFFGNSQFLWFGLMVEGDTVSRSWGVMPESSKRSRYCYPQVKFCHKFATLQLKMYSKINWYMHWFRSPSQESGIIYGPFLQSPGKVIRTSKYLRKQIFSIHAKISRYFLFKSMTTTWPSSL